MRKTRAITTRRRQLKGQDMIVTDKFVFIHMHKCGGTFINLFIKRFFPSAKEIGYHYPIGMLPAKYRHLPVLGTVRNPWEFYVSYYMFQKEVLQKALSAIALLTDGQKARLCADGVDLFNGVDALFSYLSRDGTLDFAATLNGFLDLSTSREILDGALARMPKNYGQRGPDTPTQRSGFRGMDLLDHELAKISNSGCGFYTFLFKRMYGDGEAHILPTARLSEGLLAFLRSVSIEITPEMKEYVMKHPRENSSQHAHYAAYYPPRLMQRVADQESLLIQRYGFEFEPAPETKCA